MFAQREHRNTLVIGLIEPFSQYCGKCGLTYMFEPDQIKKPEPKAKAAPAAAAPAEAAKGKKKK